MIHICVFRSARASWNENRQYNFFFFSTRQIRKSFSDQIGKIFPLDDGLPEVLYLIHTAEHFGNQLFDVLHEKQYKVMGLGSSSDIRTGVTFLVNKMQKL